MKIPHLFWRSLLAALLSSVLAVAQSTTADPKVAKKTAPTTAEPAAPAPKKPDAAAKTKREWYPFHGIVSGVNTTASTLSLHKEEGERVIRLDGKSTLSRLGKPATLSDVKVGDYAHGKLHKNARNEELISDAKFDKEAPTKAAKKAKKATATTK